MTELQQIARRPAATQEHRKLVSTHPREAGAVGNQGGEPVSNLHQHPVAHEMPVQIVDLLEAVEVQHDDAVGLARVS